MADSPAGQRSLAALEATILQGSRAVALEPRRRRPVMAAVVAEPVRVLDIRRIPLTQPRSRRVSLLISEDDAGPLAIALVGNQLGLRSSRGNGQTFDEQTIELAESDVFGSGQRRWFACPGVDGRPCGSRRMKLYLPPRAPGFACAACHGLTVPHVPQRPLLWRGQLVNQLTLSWREPSELRLRQTA